MSWQASADGGDQWLEHEELLNEWEKEWESEGQSDEDSPGGPDERLEDGGGLQSDADWLEDWEAPSTVLGGLRQNLKRLAKEWDIEARVAKGFENSGPGLLTQQEL